ncbi:MAG: lipid A biosynthesis acyltransferase, partial [Synergistaceae bacterium]|nr:lipid A biosynthesis acyltransferase [Synergistaceae bacterium]
MFIIHLMPHKIALAFGRSVGRLLRLILWKKTDRCESRCVMSLGVGITIAREIIRKAYMNLGMSVIEFIRLPKIKPRIKDYVNFQPESVKKFRDAIAKGKGVIVMDT